MCINLRICKEQKRKMKVRVFLLFLVFLLQAAFFVPSVFTQDSTWVTVEGMAAMENVTKEEARRLAEKDAMRRAVEQVVGIDILAETIVIDYKVSGDIIRALPYGKVIDKEIIEQNVEKIQQHKKATPHLTYKVKMRVKVFKESGKKDPFFKIQANINRQVLKEGDDVKIEVTPTNDCYVTIFNILEDDKVIKLIPNRFRKGNFVKGNETFIFPDEDDRRRGIKLQACVGKEKKSVVETYYILGTKQPVSFDSDKYVEGIFGIYNGNSSFVRDLIKEVVEIPLSERAERFLQYRITRQE